MIYVTEEMPKSFKTGIHFYPLSDKASFGFRIVRAKKWLKQFRYSKKTGRFHFALIKAGEGDDGMGKWL